MGVGGGQNLVEHSQKCCTGQILLLLNWHIVLAHITAAVGNRLVDGFTSLVLRKKKNKSSLQPLPFLLVFWVVCDIFCLLSQPVVSPNTSALVSGSQDLLGALIKPCPSHGVYGRGTGE